MKKEADPLLLSLLEKIANPLSQVELTVTLKGVFAPAEQWKQSDEASPNVFTYGFEVCGSQFAQGRIEPRKLTEKELKEQEEAKAKKGAKKDAKEEEKQEELSPEEQARRREWEALPEEERFYRTQEDPFKAFSLQWTDSSRQSLLSGDQLQQFQDWVTNGSVEVVLTRRPEGGEEEIAKLKKAKAKGLNLGELYSAQYKGSLSLEALAKPGAVKTLQRVSLSFGGELPAECIRIDAEKCYALVEISVSSPLNPLVKEQRPTARELLGEKQDVSEPSLLSRLQEEIRKGMRAISQEYSAFFAKQKEHGSEERRLNMSNSTNLLTVSTLRLNQISKRKEQFLVEFAGSGKFALLRERLSKTVKAIVIDKCRKQKNGSAVSRQQLHSILSELNVYLAQLMADALDKAVAAEANALHQDLVLGHQYNRAARRQAVVSIGESRQQREARLAHQYETIRKVPEAAEKLMNLVVMQEEAISSLEDYARFCLRHGRLDQAYAIYTRIAARSHLFQHSLIISFFQAQRGRQHEALTLLTGLAEGEASAEDKALVHNLLSFLYERLRQEKRAQKHLAIAEKYFQMRNNANLKINPPKNPYIEPSPRVPKPGKYVSQLSSQEAQDMRLQLINRFIDFGFFSLAWDYLKKLADSDRKKVMTAQILASEGKFDQAADIVDQLIDKKPKDLQLLLLKAEICFSSERLFQCEQVFLTLLRLKPAPTLSYSIYLQLGLTYLQRKSWEDAKATFNKAVELRPNSAAGWLGLGVANLRLGLLLDSQEALSLSRVYNPLSQEAVPFLRQIEEVVREQHLRSYQYLEPVPT